MKCSCCKIEMKEGKASCNICGMPTLAGDEKIRASVISEIRHKHLDNVSVSVKTYRYEVAEGKVSENTSEYVKIADAINLKFDEIQWLNVEFEGLESQRKFEVELLVGKKGKEQSKKVTFTPSKSISHQKVGICLKPGFQCAVVVGSQKSFETSETFSLI